MFISHRYRLVFLEVPRTASRSMTAAFAALDPDSPTVVERARYGGSRDYHNFRIPAELWSRYRVVACHRNPYDRVYSFWRHRQRTGNPDEFKALPFERYIDWVVQPEEVPEVEGAMRDAPISELFDCDRVDTWLRYESIGEDWAALRDALGVGSEALPDLPHLNASKGEMPPDAFDAPLAARVADRFTADFERFGYDRESWRSSSREVIEPSTPVIDASAPGSGGPSRIP